MFGIDGIREALVFSISTDVSFTLVAWVVATLVMSKIREVLLDDGAARVRLTPRVGATLATTLISVAVGPTE